MGRVRLSPFSPFSTFSTPFSNPFANAGLGNDREVFSDRARKSVSVIGRADSRLGLSGERFP